MKINFLCPRIEGFGATRHMIELSNGLVAAGHNVKTYTLESTLNNGKQKINQNFDIKLLKYSDETYDTLNDCDFLFILSMLDNKKDAKEYKDKFADMICNRITTKKVFFYINHNPKLGSDFFDYPELINNIDYIVTFSPTDLFFQKVVRYYGEWTKNKFVHLMLPYSFDDTHSRWTDPATKIKEISYFGRTAAMKDPCRLIRARHELMNLGLNINMYGIFRNMEVTGYGIMNDLIYKFDPDTHERIGPSDICVDLTAVTLDDISKVNIEDRNKELIYVFGKYKRDVGMHLMSNVMFGCDFFNLRENYWVGESVEFANAEIIDSGTVLCVDKDFIESCHLLVDGKRTSKNLYDLNFGVGFKKDLSNIDEVADKLNELQNNPKLYDEYRRNTFDIAKQHYDPIGIANKLIYDLTIATSEERLKDAYQFIKGNQIADYGSKELF